MVRFKIDNIEVEVPEVVTVFQAAKTAGISIPTLCHKDGIPHYSSCMVCMVKDKRTNGFVPSCSALVQNEMDIDASGPDVITLRKKAIELLLTEHRAECEAPCRVVCPAGYNIPLMNRLLASGNLEAAVSLSLSELNSVEIYCIKCSGYCENACRRKKVDTPISIRNIKLFIDQKISKEGKQYLPSEFDHKNLASDLIINEKIRRSKRFKSLIGKLEPGESEEWLKEVTDNNIRHREITDDHTATSESKSCMHCDCRAADDCQLRDISEKYELKDPRGKLVNSLAIKKINYETNLIFENAKCIKCGLCVRVCEDKTDEPALCFINRGFISIISEPLTCEFVETMKTTSEKCIEVCPTGALAQFK